jgi:beta-lactamase regulating signal transducer with metallopeptidase domain
MMDLISKLFSELIIQSIGWTIVHSLWQGLVITIIFILLVILFKKSSANARYLIGVGMLALMMLVSILTFTLVYNSEINQNRMENPLLGKTMENVKGSPGGFFSLIRIYFDRNLPAVVTIWLMGMMFFFLKFVSAILYNQRLRHHQTRDVSNDWKDRLQTLARKLMIKPAVSFKESFATRIPLTIGHFKPMIIFPVGILSQIPLDQVEALIVHELAHILRRDYIVNIFQNVMDIIYFYHPGVRWISHQVRSERENCCDDITVDNVGDSLNYARALTRVGEYSLKSNEDLAMAASRNSSKLFKRIRRLFTMTKDRSKILDGFMSFLVMFVFVFSLVFCANASCWLFASSAKKADVSDHSGNDVDKDEVKKLMERYEKLSAKYSSLTEAESREMKKLAAKLKSIQKMEEEKKYRILAEDYEKLKAKKQRTEAEDKKLTKLTLFLKEYELKLKYAELTRTYKELKGRERDLSKTEREKLRIYEHKIQAHEMDLKRSQEKEFQAQVVEYKKLKANEKDLNEKEKAKMKKLYARLISVKQQIEAEKKAEQEEKRKMREKLLALKEKKNRTQEEEIKLKELKRYFREQELKKIELKRQYEVLGKKIQGLEKREKLTEEEQDLLKKYKNKQKQIKEMAKQY